jgi:hypothetical protein
MHPTIKSHKPGLAISRSRLTQYRICDRNNHCRTVVGTWAAQEVIKDLERGIALDDIVVPSIRDLLLD